MELLSTLLSPDQARNIKLEKVKLTGLGRETEKSMVRPLKMEGRQKCEVKKRQKDLDISPKKIY